MATNALRLLWGQCGNGNIYLFELYPDSIDIATDDGSYPLHLVAAHAHVLVNTNEGLRLLSLLLKHDKGAVSTSDSNGNLPLHYACKWGEFVLAAVKLLFDAHPDGIFFRNNGDCTPMDMARYNHHADVVHFFEIQLEIQHQAQEDQEPDSNGQLPIHRVLQTENISLGTIKLMVTKGAFHYTMHALEASLTLSITL